MDGPTAINARAMRDIRAIGSPMVWVPSAARTTSADFAIPGGWGRVYVFLKVTALGTLAGDHLDVYIDWSPDGGTTFFNGSHFTQLDGNGAAVTKVHVFDSASPGTAEFDATSDCAETVVRPWLMGSSGRVRTVNTNGGGTHSFTFSVFAFGQC